MSGKCRPSLRRKTLENVKRCNLSETDKDCIEAVFKEFERLNEMTEKMLINIPNEGNYIEILGHKIDGFDSFESFCEYLKKYAELEETVNRQQAEIERLQIEKDNLIKTYAECATVLVKEFAERVLDLFPADKNFTTISRFTVRQILKEMVGEG